MKTKKLLMMLSAMATMVAGSTAKAETEKGFQFPFDQQKDINPMSATSIFQQDELARIPVKGSYVSIVKGWQAGTKVETNEVPVVVDGKTLKEEVISTNRVDAADLSQADRVWTVPFIAHDGNMRHGFAKAWSDDTVGFLTNGISTVTFNPDNGKMYVFENHDQSHDHFWEVDMNLGAVTATEPVAIIGQLKPQSTEVPFYSENDDSKRATGIRVDKAFAWGNGTDEYIVTYKESSMNNTTIWHRDENDKIRRMPRNGQSYDIKPEEVTFTEDKIYVSDGTNLYSMDKANPTNGYTQVELSAGNQGYGVTSTGIYQVNAEGYICDEAGMPMNLYKKIAEDTAGIEWGPYENKGAFTDMMVDDKGRLITAFSADAEVDVKDLYIGEAKHPMKAISGVQKIVSAQNGVIQALTKSGATIQRTYGE